MSESAWKWGAYRAGMGRATDDRRIIFAVKAIKRELVNTYHFTGINPNSSFYGQGLKTAVREFQEDVGLPVDGMVGRSTANALWAVRTSTLPFGWLRALTHWESGDDPGAEFANPDGTFDRGLCQLNSENKPLSEEEAFDPETALAFAANYIRDVSRQYVLGNCAPGAPNRWHLGVGAWRAPLGAKQWCEAGIVEPEQHPAEDDPLKWAKRAAFYVGRVDTVGRMGWVT